MFERFTQDARRVIFFSRYEAGSGLCGDRDGASLLGALRENSAAVARVAPNVPRESLRAEIEGRNGARGPIPTSLDLPLSDHARSALRRAAPPADGSPIEDVGLEDLLRSLLQAGSPPH